MRITLKQIIVFDAVARLGTISEAAKAISLSQSGTTMSLQELERGLNVPLFHRYRKKLTLNENGRRLQPKARSLISQARDIEMVPDGERLQGLLGIGATVTMGQYVLPRICRDFIRNFPDVKLSLSVANTAEIIAKVEGMVLDIAVIEAPSNRPMLETISLGHDPLKIFASPEHPLARKKLVSIDDLKNQNWFLPGPQSISRTTLMMALRDRVGVMNIPFESDVPEAVKQAVKGSTALSCASFLTIENELAAGTLAEVKVADLTLSRTFNLIYRRDVYQGNVQQSFIDYVTKVLSPTLRQD